MGWEESFLSLGWDLRRKQNQNILTFSAGSWLSRNQHTAWRHKMNSPSTFYSFCECFKKTMNIIESFLSQGLFSGDDTAFVRGGVEHKCHATAKYFLLSSPFGWLWNHEGNEYFLELCLHPAFCPNTVISGILGKNHLCEGSLRVDVPHVLKVDCRRFCRPCTQQTANPRAKHLPCPPCTAI